MHLHTLFITLYLFFPLKNNLKIAVAYIMNRDVNWYWFCKILCGN